MTVLGVPSGQAATALGPRRTMLVSDLSRAGLIALIPILHWAGALSFPVLLVVGFSVGAFFPAYSSSQQLVMAALLEDDELRMTRVGGLFGSVNETASFVGPAVGGLLVALIGAPNVLAVDAATFLVAFGLVALLRAPDAEAGAGGPRGRNPGRRPVAVPEPAAPVAGDRARGGRDRVHGDGGDAAGRRAPALRRQRAHRRLAPGRVRRRVGCRRAGVRARPVDVRSNGGRRDHRPGRDDLAAGVRAARPGRSASPWRPTACAPGCSSRGSSRRRRSGRPSRSGPA